MAGRFMEDGEFIDVGSKVTFSSHVVKIVECSKSTSPVEDVAMDRVGSKEVFEDLSVGVLEESDPTPDVISVSSAVHDVMSLGFDFTPGI